MFKCEVYRKIFFFFNSIKEAKHRKPLNSSEWTNSISVSLRTPMGCDHKDHISSVMGGKRGRFRIAKQARFSLTQIVGEIVEEFMDVLIEAQPVRQVNM